MTTIHHDHPSVASVPVPEGWELRHVDPATLVDNPDNARRPERDREGLASSIIALGILTPPLARLGEDGELILIAGERRKYSAIKAELSTIPVFVRNDLSPVHQVAGMLVENIGREDLTPIEEAVAIQQLAGFDGVTQKAITEMTGIKAGKVRQALNVARSDVATEVAGRYDLTLDQATVVAEFADDPEAVKLLTASAVKHPEQWPHVVVRLRRDRDDRQRHEAVVSELTEAGCVVVELDSGYWPPEGARWLDELPPVKGKALREARHRSCPGHAAAVIGSDEDDGYQAGYLCLDPIANGHVTLEEGDGETPGQSSSGQSTGGWTEEQKTERRVVVANNKAWDAAEEVRRAFVTDLLHRRSTPKGTLRFVTETLLLDPGVATSGDDRDLDTVLGHEEATAGEHWSRPAATALLAQPTSDARLPMLLLAQVAAGIEATTGRASWRSPSERLARYFGYLESVGYGVSEVERLVFGEKSNGSPSVAWHSSLQQTMPRRRAGALLCLPTTVGGTPTGRCSVRMTVHANSRLRCRERVRRPGGHRARQGRGKPTGTSAPPERYIKRTHLHHRVLSRPLSGNLGDSDSRSSWSLP
jgi:ParB family transcriptional regulator, chromosome partitioning protein